MPAPIRVELEEYDPGWAEAAAREAMRLRTEIGEAVITVHHIGSTAIPGIRAKPILDLMPVVENIVVFDKFRSVIESLGYLWWGEYGLPGRRYCTRDDPLTGRRNVQLHCYENGSPEIKRHLAFRDYIKSDANLAREYDAEKCRCRELHPFDSHAYSDCKSSWIRRTEALALATVASTDTAQSKSG